jgi:HAD superfamily hydrolase (TIGR01509 family)
VAIDLIIFDCDGTLVDSEELGNKALAETLTKHGYAITPQEATTRFRGMKIAACLQTIENESGLIISDAFEDEFRSQMATLFEDELQPVEGALSLISGLRINYCIASNGPRSKIENSLRITGLLPYFKDCIFSSYEVGIWKPDPGFFLHIADQYQTPPSKCGVVEDSFPGIKAGVDAGMKVWAYAPRGPASNWPAGVEHFSSMSGLNAHFRKLGLSVPDKSSNENS